MTFVVKCLFFVVACVFWASCGTVFWCLLAIRTLAVFTVSFLYGMFTDQAPAAFNPQLDQLADLWFRGFRNAYESVFGAPVPATLEQRNGRLLLEILWATICVYTTLLIWMPQRVVPALGVLGRELGTFLGNVASGWLFAVPIAVLIFVAVVACWISYNAGVTSTESNRSG